MDKKTYEFISTRTKDPIVEWKTCAVSGKPFAIFQSDLDFYDKISPSFNGVKYPIPAPTLCPEEREKRRLTRKNERKLYRRICDASGKNIVSLYVPDKPYKVYDQKIWRSDNRNPLDYGRDYDAFKDFFQQFDELLKEVPLMNVYVKNSENSEYNNIIDDCKNCYLCVSTWAAENTLYTTLAAWLKNCVDGYLLLHSENCYETTDCDYCYECLFAQKCNNCKLSRYITNCSNCENCFLCANLQHKTFCILNKQYSEEEYKTIVNSLKDKDIFDAYYQKYLQLISEQPLSNNNINSPDCIWWMISNSENCIMCFDTIQSKDCKYWAGLWLDAVDCYDCWGGDVFQSQISYESASVAASRHILFSFNCRYCNDLSYCFDCYTCKNLFACVWLRNKEYCIFNKQYTPEEYEKIVSQILEKMKTVWQRWEFFPMAISPFGYNETMAHDFFPQTKEDISRRKGKRQDISYDAVLQDNSKILKWEQIPQNISQVGDDVLDSILICEVSGRPFKITKTELAFYRKYNLPLPRKHPDIRHQERINKRQPRDLHVRNCTHCQKEFLSVYDETHKGNTYCTACYTKEIYW